MPVLHSASLHGFTPETAEEFVSWYENAGEQLFYEWLAIRGLATTGCSVDVHYKGNTGTYMDKHQYGVSARIRQR